MAEARVGAPSVAYAAAGETALLPGGDPFADRNLSRNAPCPCGSGRKYKHCHGALA